MFARLYEKIRLFLVRKKEPYLSFYQILGFYPGDVELYEQAIHHRSSSLEPVEGGPRKNNERLEFLGDAVLGTVVADIVYKHFPFKKEGFLTNTRSKIVQRESLNRMAIRIGLDKLIVYSTRTCAHNNYMFGNALEALIGAVYLDKGYRVCYRFVKERLLDRHLNLEAVARKEVNFKSSLIEWSQKNKLEISFHLIESFADNSGNPVFQTEVRLLDTPIGVGTGYTKKESQQQAAKMATRKLRTDKDIQLYISSLKETLYESPGEVVEESNYDDLPDESAVELKDKSENLTPIE